MRYERRVVKPQASPIPTSQECVTSRHKALRSQDMARWILLLQVYARQPQLHRHKQVPENLQNHLERLRCPNLCKQCSEEYFADSPILIVAL